MLIVCFCKDLFKCKWVFFFIGLAWHITCYGSSSLVKHGRPFKKCVCISKTIALELNAKQRAHLNHTKQMLCGRCCNDTSTDAESITPEESNAARLMKQWLILTFSGPFICPGWKKIYLFSHIFSFSVTLICACACVHVCARVCRHIILFINIAGYPFVLSKLPVHALMSHQA